ncbi:MAG: hypothetical protein K6A42_07340 [Treponema sp.]|nr:hypothetical protein [Treponema sp.]
MTTGEFADKVFAMREAQKEYFRLRTAEALRLSKSLEKEVDSILLTRKNRPIIANYGVIKQGVLPFDSNHSW